jgi:hypothetical protein
MVSSGKDDEQTKLFLNITFHTFAWETTGPCVILIEKLKKKSKSTFPTVLYSSSATPSVVHNIQLPLT